ncbi:carbamoyltransferase HypF [Streptomyces sp. YH02]|uniref:carbamoyltransferase HypF n=1 Tax=Streptomyces sp. YH02 TaxID=3256999 RepID=UPI003757D79F
MRSENSTGESGEPHATGAVGGTGTGTGPVPSERWLIRVEGVVQGVGYRPFVYTLAHELGLTGWVLNDSLGVLTEVYGSPVSLTAFARALRDRAPLLARVNGVRVEETSAGGEVPADFTIRESVRGGDARTTVPPDSHVCPDCLAEVRDPGDRRHRYPFANCTHCGPRYSIIRDLPYDRAQTTMGSFTLCAECRHEYEDPGDRRYHAQPTACPACGPRVTLSGPGGVLAEADAAMTAAVEALAAGRIVAVKSVGGFHLAVDARDAEAVARLRRRKKRDSKPFAVMVEDLATVGRIAVHGRAEDELLRSPARPIVLLRKVPHGLPEAVAPRNPNIGVMLPSAPLHHLLLDHPSLDVLVMTSGNISGYPIVHRNEDALAQLFEVADLVLHHDRDIHIRVDDSVVRCTEHPGLDEPVITFLRRSRGYAPYPVTVDALPEPILAYGAELKTTIALGSGDEVYVSQHIGDLKNDETFASHRQTAAHLAELYGLKPRFVACDLHPSFRSHIQADAEEGVEVIAVQHHHAHMASCMAENRIEGTTLGVVFDGAGYGTDGTIWGGEFLLGDYAEVRRTARLRHIPLLGGDKAVHEPIRTAYALALDTFGGDVDAALAAFPVLGELTEQERHVYATMARRGVNAPPASSMGRLFDGVAALLGVCSRAEYEAQGPIELEGLLGRDLTLAEPYPFAFAPAADPAPGERTVEIDFRPVVRAIAADLAAGLGTVEISRRFHSAVVDLVRDRGAEECRAAGTDRVVLSGGVFLNEFLLVNSLLALRAAGLSAHTHSLVPTNDGGIALGQVMVAAARSGPASTAAPARPAPNER